jgi:hypothetical protein
MLDPATDLALERKKLKATANKKRSDFFLTGSLHRCKQGNNKGNRM